MFKKTHIQSFECMRCGKMESVYTGPHGMVFRAMIVGIPGWINVIAQNKDGFNEDYTFCSVKCTRKWLKKNAKA